MSLSHETKKEHDTRASLCSWRYCVHAKVKFCSKLTFPHCLHGSAAAQTSRKQPRQQRRLYTYCNRLLTQSKGELLLNIIYMYWLFTIVSSSVVSVFHIFFSPPVYVTDSARVHRCSDDTCSRVFSQHLLSKRCGKESLSDEPEKKN